MMLDGEDSGQEKRQSVGKQNEPKGKMVVVSSLAKRGNLRNLKKGASDQKHDHI